MSDINTSDITILAMEIYGYPQQPEKKSAVLAEYKGRRFYFNPIIPTELINDGNFGFISYLKQLTKDVLGALLQEEMDAFITGGGAGL